ncbi:MAG: hypothetical protein AB2705_18615, partial [Candidatus Thiodiazotropha sp.]
FQQSFLTHGNTSFISSVFDLIRDYGLYRDSSIVLITKSNRKGIRAASLLQVAGYHNILVIQRVGNSDGLMEVICNKKQLCALEKNGFVGEINYSLNAIATIQ